MTKLPTVTWREATEADFRSEILEALRFMPMSESHDTTPEGPRVIYTNTPRPGDAPGSRDRNPSDPTATLLTTRATTHGDFADNAKFAQGLKAHFQDSPGYASLTLVQREAIDFICSKFGRVMSGQPDFADHWADISGYARLVADRCSRQ